LNQIEPAYSQTWAALKPHLNGTWGFSRCLPELHIISSNPEHECSSSIDVSWRVKWAAIASRQSHEQLESHDCWGLPWMGFP
jgi:hypothetical protein